jgi:endonuclease/exonuclease/phosphatase (EEP) superfamily protein YafD
MRLRCAWHDCAWILTTSCAIAGCADWHSEALGEPADRVGLRVATFNAHNLFNDQLDGSAGASDADELVLGSAEYQRKLRGVARIVDALEAEVVLLQEVESRAVLDELAGQTAARYRYRVLEEGNDPRGIDVALLCSQPVLQHRTHRHDVFPLRERPEARWYTYARDCLEVHLQVGGARVILLVVHFKSKYQDDPDLRLAEAQHTRQIADNLSAEYPDAGVLIAGDFNDVPGSATLAAIEGSQPCYASAARRLAERVRWTVASESQAAGGVLHDDLWAHPRLDAVLEAGSVSIIHDDELDAELAASSDHAPLAATYRVDAR